LELAPANRRRKSALTNPISSLFYQYPSPFSFWITRALIGFSFLAFELSAQLLNIKYPSYRSFDFTVFIWAIYHDLVSSSARGRIHHDETSSKMKEQYPYFHSTFLTQQLTVLFGKKLDYSSIKDRYIGSS
jgi:hypothetical protein